MFAVSKNMGIDFSDEILLHTGKIAQDLKHNRTRIFIVSFHYLNIDAYDTSF